MLKIVMALMSNTSGGGLLEVLAKLQNAGLGDQVSSWLGRGENAPVASGDVENAVSQETLSELADQFAMQREEVAGTLANALPGFIDKLSPNGELSDDNDLVRQGLSMFGGLLRR